MNELETKTAPYWAILKAHNIAIRFSFESHAMNFHVFDAAEGWRAGETVGEWGLFDGQNDFTFEEWERAEVEIDGGLKWDGCINWQTNPECMMHGCGPGHARKIADIFATVYHIGKRHFDLLGDEAPPLPDDVEIRPATLAIAMPPREDALLGG